MSPIESELTGANSAIFPVLSAWGWEIAMYLFLGGLVAGLMLLSGTIRLTGNPHFPVLLRWADLAAAPLLAVGLVLLLVDLSQLKHVWRLYTTFQVSSPMSWGAWILLVSMFVLALWFASHVPGPNRAVFWASAAGQKARGHGLRGLILWGWTIVARIGAWARQRERALAATTAVLGLGVGMYTGLLLSTMPARPLWNSAVLAPLFVVSGIATGGAFVCLLIPQDEHERLAPVSLAACGIELALLFVFVLTLATGTGAAQRASAVLLGGSLGLLFVVVTLTLGLIVPALVETFEVLHRRLAFVPVKLPPILKLAGGLALRMVIIYAGVQSFI